MTGKPNLWETWSFIYCTANELNVILCLCIIAFFHSQNQIWLHPPLSSWMLWSFECTVCTFTVSPAVFSLSGCGRWRLSGAFHTQAQSEHLQQSLWMIKQLLTANRAARLYPGHCRHLRKPHSTALFNSESSLWLSSAGCAFSLSANTEILHSISTIHNSLEMCCCCFRKWWKGLVMKCESLHFHIKGDLLCLFLQHVK